MSLTFNVRTDELWPSGWYPATIKSVERVPNKFADDESLKFIVLLRREDGEEREHWDWCSLPTSTKSKGYAWYRGVMGADPPKGTCPWATSSAWTAKRALMSGQEDVPSGT